MREAFIGHGVATLSVVVVTRDEGGTSQDPISLSLET